MRSTKLISVLTFAVMALSLTVISACSKTTESIFSKTIVENSILSYLPETTLGFITWDAESDSYQKLKKSTISSIASNPSDIVNKIKTQGGEDTKKIIPILDGLIETGFIGKTATDESVIKKGLAFFDVVPGGIPTASIFMSASSNVDLTEKVGKLQQIMNAQGYKTTKESVAGMDAFSLDVKANVSSDMPIDKVYIASKKEKLSIGSTPEAAAKFFNEAPSSEGYDKLKETNEYKNAIKALGDTAGNMTLAFFDVNKLVKAVEKSTGEPDKDLAMLPVESIAMTSTMKDSLLNTIAASLSPKDEEQKSIIGALSGATKNDLTSKFPAQTMLLLNIDGTTIKAIKNASLKELPPEAVTAMASTFDMVDSIKSLGVGLRAASGASPFPELVLLAQSDKAPALKDMLKEQIEGGMAMSGMQFPWQEKEIQGLKTTYTLTPFGVGLYITNTSNLVVISSSEKLVDDTINSDKDNSKGVVSGMSESSKGVVKDGSPLVLAFSDFNKIADALVTAQDSLAMFTGGKSNLDKESIDAIKKMGTVLFSFNLNNNVAKFESTFEATAPAK